MIGAALGAALLLTGCKKAQTYELNRETNYPITWTENTNGTVNIKLDGSYKAEEYTWEAICSDDTLITIKPGKEKKGVITYQITPIGEGTASVEFKRSRAIEEIPPVPEFVSDTENDPPKNPELKETETPDEVDAFDQEPEYIPSGTMLTSYDDDGNLVEVPFFSEDDVVVQIDEPADNLTELEAYHTPEDVVCKFTLIISSEAKGKKKFTATTTAGDFFESEGLTICSYGERFWRLSDNQIIVLVPPCDGIWLESDESAFSGKYYQELNPDGSINEMKELPMPQLDDEGNPVVLEVSRNGLYRDYSVFYIRGLGEGTGVVKLSSPALKVRITFNVSMDRYGAITVDSFQEEEYTPSALEIEEGIGDMVGTSRE